MGQRYVTALTKWLGDEGLTGLFGDIDEELYQKIRQWLGKKDRVKERLVRLVLARMTWNWEQLEAQQRGGRYEDLEFQACRMDICHYQFPYNLDMLLQGIGQMKAPEDFEGCGSCHAGIKLVVKKEVESLENWLRSLNSPASDDRLKTWLVYCMAKTLKEQAGLTWPIYGLERTAK